MALLELSAARADRLARAYCALEGLSVGDALGEGFFGPPWIVERRIEARALPAPPWPYTDDTQMALSIVAVLRDYGEIQQDALAASFAARYDPSRGYGWAMRQVLVRPDFGQRWREVVRHLFGGQGSFGNGAAMRVAPVGAYFADDLDAAAEQAARAAEVTHVHPEGIAGAVAVALAAAQASRLRGAPAPPARDFLDSFLPRVPESDVRAGLRRARDLPAGTPVETAVAALGNGSRVSAQDTVPFALWCAAQHLDDYEAALWLTVSGLGDRDTTCAIAGGVVACATGVEGIPRAWRERREPLPAWVR